MVSKCLASKIVKHALAAIHGFALLLSFLVQAGRRIRAIATAQLGPNLLVSTTSCRLPFRRLVRKTSHRPDCFQTFPPRPRSIAA